MVVPGKNWVHPNVVQRSRNDETSSTWTFSHYHNFYIMIQNCQSLKYFFLLLLQTVKFYKYDCDVKGKF